MRALVRVYAYLFHAALALALIGISAVSLLSRSYSLRFEFLPWKEKQLTLWILFLAIAGLVSLILALRGAVRILFFLWTLFVSIMLVRGFFFSSFSFGGPGEFRNGLIFLVASLVAVLGGWFQFRAKRPAR